MWVRSLGVGCGVRVSGTSISPARDFRSLEPVYNPPSACVLGSGTVFLRRPSQSSDTYSSYPHSKSILMTLGSVHCERCIIDTAALSPMISFLIQGVARRENVGRSTHPGVRATFHPSSILRLVRCLISSISGDLEIPRTHSSPHSHANIHTPHFAKTPAISG